MGYRILLVSQDRWLVDKVRGILEDADFEIEIALTGAVGVSVAVERRVDLLLVDEAIEDFHNICKIKDPASATYRLPAVVIAADGRPAKKQVDNLIPLAVFPREFDTKELLAKISMGVRMAEKLKRPRVVA